MFFYPEQLILRTGIYFSLFFMSLEFLGSEKNAFPMQRKLSNCVLLRFFLKIWFTIVTIQTAKAYHILEVASVTGIVYLQINDINKIDYRLFLFILR